MRLGASLAGCAVLLLTACAGPPAPAQIETLGQLGAAYIAAGGECQELVEQYRENESDPAVAACGDSTELVLASDGAQAQRVATERQLREQTVLVNDRWVIRDAKVSELQAAMGGEIVTLAPADGPANMADAIQFDKAGPVKSEPVLADGVPSSPAAAGDLPEVLVVLDASCDYCNRFLQANDKYLDQLADEGRARVAYRPVSLGDKEENGYASALGANALACVADASPERYRSFQSDLLTRLQDAPFDAAAVSDIASKNGADVAACIETAEFAWWVRQATVRAMEQPLQGVEQLRGVPTVMVDGELFGGDVADAKALKGFVESTLD